MLIHKKKKALILRLRDPNRVTTVIPKSKLIEWKGKEFVVVKHGPEETKVLRNMGIDAPSPIEYHYQWSGRFAPYAHQVDTSGFMSLNNRCYNLGGMGTGKTLTTLWAYDYLRKEGVVRKALVVTPLSTLERTWADEVFQHFPHLDTCVLYGSRERRMKLLDTQADIYLINHDGIKVKGFVEALAEREDIDLVIVDELAQVARNASTDRFKALNTIVNKQVPRRCWGLTGTPVPNEPTDAWAQCRLVVPPSVPPYFGRFRDQVMRQAGPYKWVAKPNAMETVFNAMQPSIRYELRDCIDLPPIIYETRWAESTAEQDKAYREMLQKLRTEADEGQILAVNEAVKSQKLLQIACGVVIGTQGEHVPFDVTPRLRVVHEVIEDAGHAKTIVFVPFVAVIPLVKDYLVKQGITVECIWGNVPKIERDRIFHDFQRSKDPKVLVAQPSTMSHGLTLTAASTIIWYSALPNNDTFEQANARITRSGQKHTQLIVMVEGTKIEQRYYARLKEKQKVQGLLLDMIEEATLAA